MSVELGLAIVATIDLCVKYVHIQDFRYDNADTAWLHRYSETFIELCSAFKHANTELAERKARFTMVWYHIRSQLAVVKRLANTNTLEKDYQDMQGEVIKILASKLGVVVSKIQAIKEKAGDEKGIKGWKFRYVRVKESLDKAIEQLEAWQRIFDPSWYLLVKLVSPAIDSELGSREGNSLPISSARSLRAALKVGVHDKIPVFLPEQHIGSFQLSDIPFCSAKTTSSGGTPGCFILERIECPPWANTALVAKDIRELAIKLKQSDPVTFHLLACKGVARHPTAFTFVFKMPPGFTSPRSLRSCLLENTVPRTLSDRFLLAAELGKSISYVHTFGFVHKNIRPETILIFKGSGSQSSIGSAFLIGFEQVRAAEALTFKAGDTAWEKNLYRHPKRQGERPEDIYVMQHDIYSLGVCLLEVGLWQSFVAYNDEGNVSDPSTIPSKDDLLQLTRDSLPRLMGTKYAEVVETCLTCLDDDNLDFGDEEEFQDEDGILVGVRYIEKVLSLSHITGTMD